MAVTLNKVENTSFGCVRNMTDILLVSFVSIFSHHNSNYKSRSCAPRLTLFEIKNKFIPNNNKYAIM